MNWRLPIGPVVLALVMTSCAGSSHPRAIHDTESVSAPRSLELYAEIRVATLRFPSGTYSLNAVDRIGFYYRAPRGIVQRTAAGPAVHNGGIFVSKRDRAKLRGYIYLAGAVTHVGNFSRAQYEFRD